MCDHCGCPRIEPFATLTIEHEVLRDLAQAAPGGDGVASRDLRELWREHAECERAALAPLAHLLGLGDVVAVYVETDRHREVVIRADPLHGEGLARAVQDHADDWELAVFPLLVMAADDVDLEAAAERFGATSSGRT